MGDIHHIHVITLNILKEVEYTGLRSLGRFWFYIGP